MGGNVGVGIVVKQNSCLLLAWCVVGLALCGCEVHNEMPASTAVSAVQLQSMPFIDGYAAGCEKAQRTGKPMLVFFTARWCSYCHQLAAETLSAQEVLELSQQFVCVRVDADREREVCRTFHINGYPTIQFLTPHGVPLNRLVGKRSSELLVAEMQTALLAVTQRAERDEYHTQHN